MRRKPRRSLLNAVAPLIVAGTLTVAATAAAAGLEPTNPTPLPDSAFAPVIVQGHGAGDLTASGELPVRGGLPLPGARILGTPPASINASAEILASLAEDQPDRAQPDVREPTRIVVDVRPVTTHVLRGPASWYCRAGVSPCTYTNHDAAGFDA